MPAPVFPGQMVAGKYRVERVLGEGGHGVVVAAQHLALGELVAIKVLRPDYATDREIVARFLREARAAVRIKGDHVTRVLDVGSMDDGAPYMVMEHLVGQDLRQVLKHRSRLAIPVAIDYVLQTCEALAEAHGIGIVHRDVKPENLFLTQRTDGSPWIKVLDFGISKAMPQMAAHETAPNLTQTQNVVGSPEYMSPEQMMNPKLVDPRTDIWGLGATLYELVAGTTPFRSDTLPELFAKILRDQPRPIERSDLPPGLSEVIFRCLEKDVERRYASIADFARALAPFSELSSPDVADRIHRVNARAFQSGQRLAPAPPEVPTPFEATPPTSMSMTMTGRRSLRVTAIAGAVFGLVVLGGVIVGLRIVHRADTPVVADAPSVTPSAEPIASLTVAIEPPPPPDVSEAPAPSASTPPPAPSAKPAAPAPRPAPTAKPSPAPATSKPPPVATSRYD